MSGFDLPPNITTVIVAILGSTLVMNVVTWIHDGIRKIIGKPRVTTDAIFDEIKKLTEITKEHQESIKKLSNDLEKVADKGDETKAKETRKDILHFNNEVIRGTTHTREEWIDCLKDIDEYEHYCETHKDFKNGYAVESIQNLRITYRKLESEKML